MDGQSFINDGERTNPTEKMGENMTSFYNSYHRSSGTSRLESALFSYPNELSPDSTTKNVCRICGKT